MSHKRFSPATSLPPGIILQDKLEHVATIEQSPSKVIALSPSAEDVSRWVFNIRALSVSKHLCLDRRIDWAREMDCSDDHKLLQIIWIFLTRRPGTYEK